MTRLLKLLMLIALAPCWAAAPDLEFHPPASAGDPQLSAVMRDLAARILPVYRDPDQERFLANLSALQLVARDYTSAAATRQNLRSRRKPDSSGRVDGRAIVYDIYARARAIEVTQRVDFSQAFTQAYREIVPRLSDRDEFAVTRWFGVPLSTLEEALQKSLDHWRARGSVPLPQAIDLVWMYLAFDALRNFGPLVGPLDAQEDRRRYVTDEFQVRTPDGATLSVTVVRAKSAKPLPALVEFSLYVSQNDAKESAARGYVGVVAYSRGVYASPDRTVPFEHDAGDARAVIDWIAEQPWCDGRVALFGSRYAGFVAWAATKRMPEALKAIATSDPMAPGIDVPMSGSIFRNSAYRWVFQATNARGPNGKFIGDEAQWRKFEQDWYRSGRRYREFASMFGSHSRLFRRWLSHPSYDRYWQRMIPFRDEFAHIDIPVLTMTGYYADGEIGALYYFTQHMQHNPKADHTLLVGPYEEGVMRRGPAPVLRGYTVDQAALVDLHDLRYQWFDHVLKGAKRPALLQDRVNYEVMGANEWRHVSSLDAMHDGVLRFYLKENPDSDRNHLSAQPVSPDEFLPQTFDLADRSDADWQPAVDIVGKRLRPHNGEMFVSEPASQPLEVSGLLSGRLDFRINKMDVDLYVALYEQLPGGEYLLLGEPYEFRASYARERVRRHLLKAGVRQQLSFQTERLMSRRIQPGSRLVLVLGINKRPDRQINYGAGDDVSEESIEDARVPVKIRWYGSSYVEIPVRGLQRSLTSGRR